MDKFIKVCLVGQGWGQSEIAKQADHQRIANLITQYFHSIAPLDGTPIDSRNITISVCDQVDKIHLLDSNQRLIIKI